MKLPPGQRRDKKQTKINTKTKTISILSVIFCWSENVFLFRDKNPLS